MKQNISLKRFFGILICVISIFSMSEILSASAAMTTAQCESKVGGAECHVQSTCTSMGYTDIAPGTPCDVPFSTIDGTCCAPPASITCEGSCKNTCSNGETLSSSGSISCQLASGSTAVTAANLCCLPAGTTSGSTGTPGTGTGTGTTSGSTGTPGTGTGTTSGSTGTPGTGGVTSSGTTTNVIFANPLKFTTFQEVLGALLASLQGIIVTISLVFIIIGAVLYILSAGDGKKIDTAKSAITAALIGLAIGVAAPSFLKEIADILEWGGEVPAEVSGSLSLLTIALNVLNFLLSVVGTLAIIMLIIGALMYITAAGDEDRIDSGKKMVTYAIIGIVVALAALAIIGQVAKFFAA